MSVGRTQHRETVIKFGATLQCSWRKTIGGYADIDNSDITARLAESYLQLTDSELERLIAPFEILIRWQGIVEGILRSRKITGSMQFPVSEPKFTHALDKKGEEK